MVKNISISIMAHPDRLHYAKELSSITGGKIYGLKQDTLWKAAQESWRNYNKESDYHMVIQDDVIVHDSIVDEALYLLDCLPKNSIVSLTSNRRINTKFNWRTSQRADTARTLILPTNLIDDWLDWNRDVVRETVQADDYRLTLYLIHKKILIWYPNPPITKQRMDVDSIYRKGRNYRDVSILSENEFWEKSWKITDDNVKHGKKIKRPNLSQLYATKKADPYHLDENDKIDKNTYLYPWKPLDGLFKSPLMLVIPKHTKVIFPVDSKIGCEELEIDYQVGISGGQDKNPVVIEFEDSHGVYPIDSLKFWFQDKKRKRNVSRTIHDNPRVIIKNTARRAIFVVLKIK